ncbi:uncharacterized protein BP5553_08301 [Venustampulla echinocandica]|uniref:Uncharacterized protein n=1 Tax=Venustampulla echinocandica TaxID=2656787 RepID=A0A370TGB9_9HELO|nr:uncharacterized protein BP5553_08301 [Venustampulla echinocandica]RDL33933.1 hypothetical protein BP5553_08301 [Venustampulla echinocandica]
MSSTELTTDPAALAAKERARIILQNSYSEAVTTAQPIDRPLRSESPEARTAAGHVRRRTDKVTNAEAPPPSRSETKSCARQPASKGKGRQNRGLGNDGDSDSDEDEKKSKKREDKDGGGAVKKPLTIVDIGGAGPSDRTYGGLSAEEKQAIQLRRAITAMDRRWAAFELHNQECKRRSEVRSPVLIAKTGLPYACLRPPEDAQLNQLTFEKYTEEYKKDALFGHIRDQVVQGDETDKMRVNSWGDHLEDVLLSVEDAFIRRCSTFAGPSTAREDSKVTRMSLMMMCIQKKLWEEVSKYGYDEGLDESISVPRFVSRHCPREGMIVDLLAEQYFRIFSEGLLEGVVARRRGLDIPTLTLMQELKNSRRKENELTLEYMSWAISVLDQTELAERCKNLLRDQTIKSFQIFTNCRQEFVDDPDDTSNKSTVSLSLLKGNKLVNTQPVSIEDLRLMGWRHQGSPSGFWRYEVRHVAIPVAWQEYLGMDVKLTGSQTMFEVMLKVRMDGEVVGIFRPELDLEWHNNWDTFCDSLRRVDPSPRSWALS